MNWTRFVSSSRDGGEGAYEEGLGDSGDAFEEDVAAAEERHDEARDRGVLADDGLGDLRAQGLQRRP